MNDYDFSTINDKEFEQISRDLLNAKYNLGLQNFKKGPDKGVDLRHSTTKNTNAIIVQAKHYVGSKFAQLKYTLSKSELNKVKKLNPDRYIITTSLSLSANEKDTLKKLLTPFVLTANDIFGREDLNKILMEFKDIEMRYFKLWFSSINVLNRVINNAIEGRTSYLLQKIKDKISFYVVTEKYDDANKILNKEKILLITGQPGIGKTTLAEVLLFDRAKNGHKIYEVNDIKEAEDVISTSDSEKQIFYFDDFLGSNYIEIMNPYKTETQLTAFVERVRNTPNKYLILTTRTIILNHALEQYEKISHSKLSRQQFELKLTDYNQYEKALILYNHLYFKEIKEELYNSILNDKFYKKIIQHKNYTPRIIEFITDNSKIDDLSPDSYLQFILNNLNNPKEIWRHSFNNQIKSLEKCLLLTIFTFNNKVKEKNLILAFETRLEFEKTEHNQIISSNQFNESLRILLNGFIKSTLYKEQKAIRKYSFINPSLKDFLIGYISESFFERKGIISSLTYYEQLNIFDPQKSIIPIEKELQLIIRDRIAKNKIKILYTRKQDKNKKHGLAIKTLCKYCDQVNIDATLLEKLKQIKFNESWHSIVTEIEYLLFNLNDVPQTKNYIQENFIPIIEKVIRIMDDPEKAVQIPLLFKKFEIDYNRYIKDDDTNEIIFDLISNVLTTQEEEFMSNSRYNIKHMSEVNDFYSDLSSLSEDLLAKLFPKMTIFYDFGIKKDQSFWEEQLEQNEIKYWKREDEYYESRYENKLEGIPKRRDLDELIDDLFVQNR